MIDKTLYEGKWLALRVKNEPDHGIKGYEYVHNVPGNGRGVAVIPYRLTPRRMSGIMGHAIEFLVVHEIIPPWKLSHSMCALTGLVDKPTEPLAFAAARELFEESGYKVEPDSLISLGSSHVSKSSDTTLFLYAVDLTDTDPPVEPPKDGTGLESQLTSSWVIDPYTSLDPVLGLMHSRLVAKLRLKYVD